LTRFICILSKKGLFFSPFPCFHFTAIATSDANAARIERQYKEELELALEQKEKTRAQLEESRSTSQQIQSTLAAVVAEKDKLRNECADMKAVCEELMELVEGSASA
jgi:septal ring factor EnvC (AmiA/AmiB activator)